MQIQSLHVCIRLSFQSSMFWSRSSALPTYEKLSQTFTRGHTVQCPQRGSFEQQKPLVPRDWQHKAAASALRRFCYHSIKSSGMG